MHSSKYELLEKYWQQGLWDERRMRDAVKKGWITTAEFEEITGITY